MFDLFGCYFDYQININRDLFKREISAIERFTTHDQVHFFQKKETILDRLSRKVDEYNLLSKEWYKNEVITKRTIDHAKKFLSTLEEQYIASVKMFPRNYNGISFLWENNDECLEVTVTSRKKILYFFDNGDELIFSDKTETFQKYSNRLIELIKHIVG